jgi:uncharacterized protein (TIGR04255 family)
MAHYNKPPIQEALIDIKVIYEDFDITAADKLHEKFIEQLPTKNARNAVSLQITPDGSSVGDTGIDGYMFQSADGNKVLQIAKDGFTFSLVNNYDSWESFYEEANKYWEIFKQEMKPSTVVRVGVRYVNKLDLPLELDKLPEYISTKLELEPISQIPTEIFARFVLPFDSHTCIVTHATNPNLLTQTSRGYIIDIDVFEETAFEVSNDEHLSTLLEELRDIKNLVFENSITDKARELFE